MRSARRNATVRRTRRSRATTALAGAGHDQRGASGGPSSRCRYRTSHVRLRLLDHLRAGQGASPAERRRGRARRRRGARRPPLPPRRRGRPADQRQVRRRSCFRSPPASDPEGTSLDAALPRRLDAASGTVELGDAVETSFYGRPVQGHARQRVVRGRALRRSPGCRSASSASTSREPACDRGAEAGVSLRLDRGARRARARGGRGLRRRPAVPDAVRDRGGRAARGGRLARPARRLRRRGRRGCDGLVGRCVVTSRSPDTGVKDLDTLRTIKRYRPDVEGEEPMPFGVYGSVERPGTRARRRCGGAAVTIDPATSHRAPSTLTVADLDAQAAFYRRRDRSAGAAPRRRRRRARRPGGGRAARAGSSATRTRRRVRPGRPGLFHLAVLVPVARRAGPRAPPRARRPAGGSPGASDHLVSEALYLDDPEGNGIEIYRDRPREEWNATSTGSCGWRRCRWTSRACSRARAEGDTGAGWPPGTTIGHVHLQVALDPRGRRRSTSARLGFDADGARATRARCSSRPAATTTTSASTPGPARASRRRRPARAGCRSFTDRAAGRGRRSRDAKRPPTAAGSRRAPTTARFAVVDPSGNRAVLSQRAERYRVSAAAARACRSYWLAA